MYCVGLPVGLLCNRIVNFFHCNFVYFIRCFILYSGILQTCCNIEKKRIIIYVVDSRANVTPLNFERGFRFREAMAFDASGSQVHHDFIESAVYQYKGV